MVNRKSCWMILVALLAAAIAAPNGYADNYTITFTGGLVDNSATCAVLGSTCFTVPSPGVMFIGTIIGDGSVWGAEPEPLRTTSAPQNDAYSWFVANTDGEDILGFEDDTTGDVTRVFPIYSEFYFSPPSGTAYVTDTSLPTPEPPSVVLTLIGIGLLVVMRKRIAKGLPLASQIGEISSRRWTCR